MVKYFNAFYFFDDERIESAAQTRELAIDDIYDYHMNNYAYTLRVNGNSIVKIDLMPEVKKKYPSSEWDIEAQRNDDKRKDD